MHIMVIFWGFGRSQKMNDSALAFVEDSVCCDNSNIKCEPDTKSLSHRYSIAIIQILIIELARAQVRLPPRISL